MLRGRFSSRAPGISNGLVLEDIQSAAILSKIFKLVDTRDCEYSQAEGDYSARGTSLPPDPAAAEHK